MRNFIRYIFLNSDERKIDFRFYFVHKFWYNKPLIYKVKIYQIIKQTGTKKVD